MNEKIKYEFDRLTGIMFKYYYGNITIEDILASWEYAFKNNLIPLDVKGFILDYRNAHFQLQFFEYQEIPDFYKRNINIFGHLRIAILINNPDDVVVPVLVSKQDEGYSSKPFLTKEAAVKWVLYNE